MTLFLQHKIDTEQSYKQVYTITNLSHLLVKKHRYMGLKIANTLPKLFINQFS